MIYVIATLAGTTTAVFHLRLSNVRFQGLDFERTHAQIVVNTSRDRLLI